MRDSVAFDEGCTALWRRLREAPHEHDLYHALRWIDARAGGGALLGRASRPQDEPVRMRQTPALEFAPATLAPARDPRPGRPPEVSIYSFGLFGPNGPLPLHLTEFVREREHHHGDRTLSAFADIFHHRAILLFYRAWADAQGVVGMDRPDNRFERHVASLVNMGSPSMRGRDSLPDHAKYFMAPHLVRQTRNPEGLVHILQSFFEVPVRLESFVVHWVELEPGQCLALGARSRGAGGLGRDSVMGLAVRDAQHRFRLEIGPVSLATYRSFLPGAPRARQLVDWVRHYVGIEFGWEVRLILQREQATGVRLGERSTPLGLSSWLGRREEVDGDACDLTLDMEARMRQLHPQAPHTRQARPAEISTVE
ncbi:MAG: type VI secretion system baseplate subunit TssG [Burkholderiaceae bacterium]